MMTRSDVEEMSIVHEIGAHSYEHATMTTESDGYVRRDVQRCRDYFRDVFGREPSVYAFPNGVAHRAQAEIVHAAGFSHVLLTGVSITAAAPWLYSRRLIYGASPREARFRAVGAFQPRAMVKIRDDAEATPLSA
jgi:peptidoglycan/xylan/chitin deacetylase (PgdA/CDA1 family)